MSLELTIDCRKEPKANDLSGTLQLARDNWSKHAKRGLYRNSAAYQGVLNELGKQLDDGSQSDEASASIHYFRNIHGEGSYHVEVTGPEKYADEIAATGNSAVLGIYNSFSNDKPMIKVTIRAEGTQANPERVYEIANYLVNNFDGISLPEVVGQIAPTITETITSTATTQQHRVILRSFEYNPK